MEHDAGGVRHSRSHALLLTLAAVAAGVGLALFTGADAHASDEDQGGLLSSLVDTVQSVEEPLATTVSGTVAGAVTGVTDVVSATVNSVAPPVASVTDPVVDGVTQPVVNTVSSVVEATPVTAITETVVTTVDRVVDRVPVVNDVVDTLPPLPAAPENPVPSVEAPEFDAPTPESPVVLATAGTPADSAPHRPEGDRQFERGASVPASLTGTGNASAPASGASDTAHRPQQELKHPSAPVSSPANSSANGSSSPTTQHPGELYAETPTRLSVGSVVPTADHLPPASPTFESDASPD